MFGFRTSGVPTYIAISLRPGDDAVRAEVKNTPQLYAVAGVEFSIWGVPADPSHTPARSCDGTDFNLGCASLAPRAPFFLNATACDGPKTTTIRATSWLAPGAWTPTQSSTEPTPTGCDALSFESAMDLWPDSSRAGAPTGLAVDLHNPQNDDPDGLATAHLRDAIVTLPEGMTVSPSAAEGLGGCTDEQFALPTDAEPACPDSSKIGTVSVKTPVFEDPLEGTVYLGSQTPSQLLRVFLLIRGHGLRIKIPGRVDPDPVTGRLTTTFDENPQLPFDSLSLRIKGGPRAPLANPGTCGTYQSEYTLTSWGGQSFTGSDPITIDENCGLESRFTPGFEAGTSNPAAGSSSPFILRVTRPDGQQNVSRIEATLPLGLTAKLAGVSYCPEAAAASGECPAASQVGTTTVGAGAGSNPLYVPQPGKAPTAAYLAGPYKGAPLSIVVKVPAQAGPFDLGTVAVRNALYVNPETTEITSKSDPLPQILQGIPISYRDIRIAIDRPDFTLNPTSCDPMAVTATITSAQGATASPSSRFQVASCERLAFKPKLSLSFSGAPNRRGGYPALKAVLTAGKDEANIGKAAVILPKTELLEQAHIRTICTRVQFAAGTCPQGSVYGHAKAWTPLLDQPLEGPVYLRANGGDRELPDLVADLGGQIDVELVGYIDTVKKKGADISRIRTRFVSVPDAPVSRFVLNMQGGRKGLLANNTNLCKAKPRAEAKFDGHNGKIHDINPLVKLSCGKKGK